MYTFLGPEQFAQDHDVFWPLWETSPDGSLMQFLKSRKLMEPMHTAQCFVRATIPTSGLWMAVDVHPSTRPNVQRHGRSEFSGAYEFPRAPKFECL